MPPRLRSQEEIDWALGLRSDVFNCDGCGPADHVGRYTDSRNQAVRSARSNLQLRTHCCDACKENKDENNFFQQAPCASAWICDGASFEQGSTRRASGNIFSRENSSLVRSSDGVAGCSFVSS